MDRTIFFNFDDMMTSKSYIEQPSIHENVSCVAILIHQIDLKSHVCVCSLKYERHMAHLGGTYVIKL